MVNSTRSYQAASTSSSGLSAPLEACLPSSPCPLVLAAWLAGSNSVLHSGRIPTAVGLRSPPDVLTCVAVTGEATCTVRSQQPSICHQPRGCSPHCCRVTQHASRDPARVSSYQDGLVLAALLYASLWVGHLRAPALMGDSQGTFGDAQKATRRNGRQKARIQGKDRPSQAASFG